MNDDELRTAIIRGRRITRDSGLLAILDEFERRLNAKPTTPRHRGLQGGPGPPSRDDRRIKKAMYQRIYMREYRKGLRRTKK
jgi:hypothetical protein